MKGLAALLKRNEPPTIARIEGDKVQLWSRVFIFELPAGEVIDDVLEKYAGPAVNCEPYLIKAGHARYEDPSDWRRHLTVPDRPHEELTVVERTTVTTEDDEEVEIAKLETSKHVARYVRAELIDFFSEQLLRPVFKAQPGETYTGDPTPISIWEGEEFVGIVAPYNTDGAKERPGDFSSEETAA